MRLVASSISMLDAERKREVEEVQEGKIKCSRPFRFPWQQPVLPI